MSWQVSLTMKDSKYGENWQFHKWIRTTLYVVAVYHSINICAAFPHPDCFVVTISRLKKAECLNKHLKEIPEDLDHDIKILDVSDNELTYLGINQFKRYLQLQDIRLARNRIENIASAAFTDLYNLQFLDLRSNDLKEIPTAALQHLASVRIVIFEGNPIRFIEKDSFAGLHSIEEIILENCLLERIDPHAFDGLPGLTELNLANNELKHLSSEMDEMAQKLKVLHINDNPWHCDCDLRWLRNRVQLNEIDWVLRKREPTCSSPPLIAGVEWSALESPEFQFACAASINSNTSTSLQIKAHSNFSIECVANGDPLPTVTWMKGSKHMNGNQTRIEKVNQRSVKSILHLTKILPSDIGDYKCIAKNKAGRSEVTFKLWVDNAAAPSTRVTDAGVTKFEIILGIGVGCILIVICITCIIIVYILRRRRNNSPARGQRGPAQKSGPSNTAVANSANNASNQTLQRNNIPHAENKTQSNDPFKMKIFVPYDSDHQSNHSEDEPAEALKESKPLAPSIRVTRSSSPPVRHNTPDLLLDPAQTNGHSTSPRAPENPYIIQSNLKSGPSQTKSSSADDLLEDFRLSPKEKRKRSSSRDDLHTLQTAVQQPVRKTRFKEPHVQPFLSDHASTCTNPVCLKDHGHPSRQQKGGLLESPRTLRQKRGVTESPPGRHHNPYPAAPMSDTYINKYRTLPVRQTSKPPAAESGHTPKRILPTIPNQRPSGAQPKSVSFNDQGHPVIDLTQETPESQGVRMSAPQDEWYKTLPAAYRKHPSEHTGATVDQLLSPPFGTTKTSKSKKHVPKPGETDEFGTAV